MGIEDVARHGPIRVAPGGRYLAHADGTPFFFLADTAWNGALLSSDDEWETYLADRAAKGFTAIQFISHAPWAGALTDGEQNMSWSAASEHKPISRRFLDRMEARVAAIGRAGMLAVPVLAWAANFGESSKYNAGFALPVNQLEKLIQGQVTRLSRYRVFWLLAGDGKYGWWRSSKWKRIGRKVFAKKGAPVGLHPMGKHWPYGRYRKEKWLDVLGYQTSHSDDAGTLRWLMSGPPATCWKQDARPVINLEPCYEGIRNAATGKAVTAAEVRRAMYASLLVAPTAGVSYGAHGVWSWETEAREPLNHAGTGIARPWREAMHFPGSFDVQRMAGLFASIDWWRLRPAGELLRTQSRDPARFISISATAERDLIIAYLPRGGTIELTRAVEVAEWFDPRTGQRHPGGSGNVLVAPDEKDWVLIVRSAAC